MARFWAAILGREVVDEPAGLLLVWDQDETAIQSPAGGTKIAWGGPPVEPVRRPPRHRFELAVAGAGLEAEAARLAAIGATRHTGGADGSVLFEDPDGNEFVLTARPG